MKNHRTPATAVTITLTLAAVALIGLGIWLLTPHSAPNASPAVSEPSQVHTPNRSAAGTASKDSSSTPDPTVLPEAEEDFAIPMHLRAKTLRFTDPLSGVEREFRSLSIY